MSGDVERVRSCENCRFRHPDKRPDYATAGECRRYPPIIVETVAFDGSGMNHFSQQWPWMHAEQWCGEHDWLTTRAGGE